MAPKPVWPAAVARALDSKSNGNPYRVKRLTDAERLAYSGCLGHLNRRWVLLGGLGTAIILVMFGVLGIPAWFSELNS